MKKSYNTIFVDALLIFTILTMTIISCFYNKVVFYFEIPFAFLCIGILIYNILRDFKNVNVLHQKDGVIDNLDKHTLERLKVPVVLLDKKYNVIWKNHSFQKIFGKEQLNLENLIKTEPISSLLNKGIETIEILDIRYSVLSIDFKEYIELYFVEDKYYHQIESEYLKSRPVVAMVMFDNKEEFEADAIDNEDDQIIAKVEGIIQKWAAGTTGFYKKLNNSRYLVVFEERSLDVFIKEKFKILEEVRSVKSEDKRWATVSIGIGADGKSLKECEHWARNALDMALGRGGDQVVVKKGKSYSFFGGVSKETEKRSKVRARVISMALSDQIDNSDKVLIMGHRFSDLDCVGAAIGMYSAAAKGKRKEAYIVLNKDETLALPLVKNIEAMNSKEIFISPEKAIGLITEKTLLIIVDTHSMDFLESKLLYEKSHKTVVIDHHRMMVNHISNAVVFYHEPYASSASEMVTELVQYLDDEFLNRIEAESLLAGIMLDSKNFVLKTGVRTFEAAAYLRRKGADTVEVKRLFSNSMNTYKVKYQLISGAEIFNSCAIACADEKEGSYEDIRIASAQAADELLGIEGVRASFVIYSSGNNSVSISARSFGDVNVQLIMEAMGGGGHQTMAGAQINDTSIKEVAQRLIELISPIEISNTKNEV